MSDLVSGSTVSWDIYRFDYRCTETAGCNFFTHFINMDACYLLIKCDEFVACENCISGPATPSIERDGALSSN